MLLFLCPKGKFETPQWVPLQVWSSTLNTASARKYLQPIIARVRQLPVLCGLPRDQACPTWNLGIGFLHQFTAILLQPASQVLSDAHHHCRQRTRKTQVVEDHAWSSFNLQRNTIVRRSGGLYQSQGDLQTCFTNKKHRSEKKRTGFFLAIRLVLSIQLFRLATPCIAASFQGKQEKRKMINKSKKGTQILTN